MTFDLKGHWMSEKNVKGMTFTDISFFQHDIATLEACISWTSHDIFTKIFVHAFHRIVHHFVKMTFDLRGLYMAEKIIKILTSNENLRNISRANGWSKSCKALTSASIMALSFIKMDMTSATRIKKVFLAPIDGQSARIMALLFIKMDMLSAQELRKYFLR